MEELKLGQEQNTQQAKDDPERKPNFDVEEQKAVRHDYSKQVYQNQAQFNFKHLHGQICTLKSCCSLLMRKMMKWIPTLMFIITKLINLPSSSRVRRLNLRIFMRNITMNDSTEMFDVRDKLSLPTFLTKSKFK